jgi:hypothetical protein
MTTNQPTSPGAPGTSWTTGVATPSPVVTPSPPGGGTPETPDPIVSPGAQDAKADDVSASVAGAVAAAEARFRSHQQDTYAQGSAIGTPMVLPGTVSDWSKHTAGSDATSYDPAG